MCLISTTAFSNSNPFIRLDSISLAKTKKMLQDGTASEQTLIAYKKLIKDADLVLTRKNPSVMDKTIMPPSGNKHDYLSISRYWWPNPETPDGLPWVRQDGVTNPETQTDIVDRKRLAHMGKGVWDLSLAYYFTNNETYANKAISMIETWFLNPDTLMNPNLEFGQSVPGNPKKRATGILDGRSIVRYVPDAVNLLSTSKYWDAKHQAEITAWLSNYLTWLTESDLGIKGSLQKNNHGSWYKFQVAALALYTGNIPLTKKMVELTQESLDAMLDDKGGQTHELARSRSFFYSCFNLEALTDIANLGNQVGMDMWHYKTENNKSLALAISYLTPVIYGETWNHDTLKAVNLSRLTPILSKAARVYNTPEYTTYLSDALKINETENQTNYLQTFYLLNN